MTAVRGLRSALAGGLVLLAAAGVGARAGELKPANQLVTCAPTAAGVSEVSVDNLHVGLAEGFVWAKAHVHLLMRDRSTREYALSGRADPVAKLLVPNRAIPGFAYPGFACTVQFAPINSVRNCRGSGDRRACDIGVRLFGVPLTYSVSMTAERIRLSEVSAIQ